MIDVPVKPLRIRSGWQQHHDRGTFCNAGSRFFDPFPDLPSIRRIAPYNTGPDLRQSVLLWGVVPFTLRIPRQSACVQGKTKLCIELVKKCLRCFPEIRCAGKHSFCDTQSFPPSVANSPPQAIYPAPSIQLSMCSGFTDARAILSKAIMAATSSGSNCTWTPKFRNQTEAIFWNSIILLPISTHALLRSGENFFSCHGVPSFFFLGIPNLCAI